MSEPNDLERALTEELDGRARGLEPPAVSTTGLVRAGRREQRRRAGFLASGAAVLVAAAVVVTVAVLPHDGRGSSPSPADVLTTPPTLGPTPATPLPTLVPGAPAPRTVAELPLGPATDVPWWADGVLHYGRGRTATITARPALVYAGGTALVVSGHTDAVSRDGGPLVTLPTHIAQDSDIPHLSADGRLCAWYDHDAVVAYDVSSHTVVGRLAFPAGPRSFFHRTTYAAAPRRVDSITADGRVVFVPPGPADRRSPVQVWTPGEPRAIDLSVPGGEDNRPTQWPGGLDWGAVDRGRPVVTLATIATDGQLTPVAIGDLEPEALWNPSGTAVADSLGQVASPYRPGFAAAQLPLPTDALGWQAVGWENDHSLVLAESRRTNSSAVLVRCAVPALTCQRIAGTSTSTAPADVPSPQA